MAEVDEYQLEKISTLFQLTSLLTTPRILHPFFIHPSWIPWLFKAKKNGGASHSLMQQTE